MTFLSLVFSLFSLTMAFANTSYQLISFENSSYRDFSLDELTASLNQDANLLPYYQCNEKNKFDIFFNAPRVNNLKNSLHIRLQNSQEVLIYQKGKFYNIQGERQYLNADDLFLANAAASLKKIEKTKNGAKLLRLLEESYFPITITLGQNSFSSNLPERKYAGIYMSQAIMIFSLLRKADDNLPFRTIGNGGDVNWNPLAKLKLVEQDGISRIAPAEILLAHELYHAFDSIRGLLDFRFVRSSSKKQVIISQEFFAPNSGITNVSEYRAVYFENLIRQELKHKLRKSYSLSETEEIPMLDENNQPVLIPAPCL